MKIEIYTDGGAIGNPGQAAIGVIIKIAKSQDCKIKKYSQAIGEATNNQAEYKAALFALKKVKQLLGAKIQAAQITLHTDSELIGNQLLGNYKIKELELQNLFVEIWNLRLDLPPFEIKIIPREKNQEADKLVKAILFKKELF